MAIPPYLQHGRCRRSPHGSVWPRGALWRTDVVSDLSDGQSSVDVYGGPEHNQLACYMFYCVWGSWIGFVNAPLAAQNTEELVMAFNGV